jgi:uncharacterized protein (DUF433 family)
VESIPGKVSGAWVFKDTRMPVSTVFENLESGATIDEIMEWFDVTREQIVPCWSSRPAVSMLRPRPRLRAVRQCRSMRILFDHGTPATKT